MVSWRSVDVVMWLLFIEVEVDGRFAFLLWYWVVLHLQVWVMDAEKNIKTIIGLLPTQLTFR